MSGDEKREKVIKVMCRTWAALETLNCLCYLLDGEDNDDIDLVLQKLPKELNRFESLEIV